MYLKKNDKVIVIAGKDKGKIGKIIATDRNNNKVVVEGVNVVTKHIKPRGGMEGGKTQVESPIHASNVMIYDPKENKRTRIGKELDKNGKKVRVTKKSNSKLA